MTLSLSLLARFAPRARVDGCRPRAAAISVWLAAAVSLCLSRGGGVLVGGRRRQAVLFKYMTRRRRPPPAPTHTLPAETPNREAVSAFQFSVSLSRSARSVSAGRSSCRPPPSITRSEFS